MDKEKLPFTVEDKQAVLYRSPAPGGPLIVLNYYSGDGHSVVSFLDQIRAPECDLLVIGNLDWAHDMAPWDCPPVFANGPAYTGGADTYLELLTGRILPQAKAMLSAEPSFIGIAGYSLAGLFAVYALYRCDIFQRAASMSGSLWYPGFTDNVRNKALQSSPDRLYFSLGDKEAKTRNPYLKRVQESTEAAADLFRNRGIHVTIEMYPGNHFQDAALRTALGISSLIGS